MGCIFSKSLPADNPLIISGHQNSINATTISGDAPNHTVSLTSSTYGVLNLDPFENQNHLQFPTHKKLSFPEPSPEIINWILADDIEDAGMPKAFLTPSPKIRRMFTGKENRTPCRRTGSNRVLKTLISSENRRSGLRQSLSPLFDPDLVASFERELHSEAEQIKQMVCSRNRKEEDRAASFLLTFEEKCPPGGEKSVVLYTTSLRGIRKTFEDCNLVRSLIESYNVCVIERDVSMDLGFREELRKLMGGSKEAKMPILFVRGRMIGGANEVLRLEEERKLEVLMEGIPKAKMSCGECGGMRFVMCKDCNGSCKVLDEGMKKKVKCVKCNENGLIHCHTCGG